MAEHILFEGGGASCDRKALDWKQRLLELELSDSVSRFRADAVHYGDSNAMIVHKLRVKEVT